LRRAQANLDGSPEARTRYAHARSKHQAAEAAVLAVLETAGGPADISPLAFLGAAYSMMP
jgi:hypothetical protein